MCLAENICRCIPLDVACSVMGIVSMVFYSSMTSASIVYLTLDTTADAQWLLKICNSVAAVRIVLCVILAKSVLAIAASVSLIFGMQKRRPGLVLFYFGYCVFLALVYLLLAILLLIEQHWIMAFSLIGMFLILIYFVVVVHTMYEDLQRDFHPHKNALTTHLVE